MARVALVHWKEAELSDRLERIEAAGHQAVRLPVEETPILRALRADPPEVLLVSLERSPSGGREVGRRVRKSPKTKTVPLLFVGGPPEKAAAIGQIFPDAVLRSDWSDLADGIAEALAVQPEDIGTPRARPTVPLAQKLGIEEGMRIVAVDPPQPLPAGLRELPAGALLTDQADGAGLGLAFLRSTADLDRVLARATAESWPHFWACWPKGSSGVETDLGDGVVRSAGLAAGWVDYKVCAVDATWSALKFAPR